MHLNFCVIILLLIIFISNIQRTCSVCVLESDFGFSLNCNLKKSGLFRVRNLGGLKAHFGLGFSLGDELGFPESIGNVEGSRKRSINIQPSAQRLNNEHEAPIKPLTSKTSTRLNQLSTSQLQKPQLMTEAMSLPLGVPKFRKISKATSQIPKSSYTVEENVPLFQTLPSSSAAEIETIESGFLKSPEIDLKGYSIKELASMANVSVETVISAIKLRKQQIVVETNSAQTSTTSTTTPSSTTSLSISTTAAAAFETSTSFRLKNKPSFYKSTSTKDVIHKKSYISDKSYKVMNAPKEYYPAGYDKNFDDNFKSKIDLPATSFHCGDQKHFPGLYADDDLGCMVFHVCALTDDGLVMKSFLCPESTLFDQTILKCNWWFYTDCKSSRTLYDSNLPVSKSYQLMKSLTFFTKNYKNSNSYVENLNKADADENIAPSI